jgi:hypothetical protein
MGVWKCYLSILTEKYVVGCWVREKLALVLYHFCLTDMYPHIRPCHLLAHWLTCVSTHSASHTPTLLTYLPHSEIAYRQILASIQVQMCLACSHWRVSRSRLPKRILNMQIVCRSKSGCLWWSQRQVARSTGDQCSLQWAFQWETCQKHCIFWYTKLSNEHPVRLWLQWPRVRSIWVPIPSTSSLDEP